MTAEPRLALSEMQSLELIACLEQGRLGSRMSWAGSFISFVPQRIGQSPALDSCVRLLSSVHTAILHNRRPSSWMDPEAYLHAIVKLRESLLDPIEGYSVETLLATALLYFLEVCRSLLAMQHDCLTYQVVVGNPDDPNFIFHAGGVARMLEVRGPWEENTGFEMHLACHLWGVVVCFNLTAST